MSQCYITSKDFELRKETYSAKREDLGHFLAAGQKFLMDE